MGDKQAHFDWCVDLLKQWTVFCLLAVTACDRTVISHNMHPSRCIGVITIYNTIIR